MFAAQQFCHWISKTSPQWQWVLLNYHISWHQHWAHSLFHTLYEAAMILLFVSSFLKFTLPLKLLPFQANPEQVNAGISIPPCFWKTTAHVFWWITVKGFNFLCLYIKAYEGTIQTSYFTVLGFCCSNKILWRRWAIYTPHSDPLYGAFQTPWRICYFFHSFPCHYLFHSSTRSC